MDSEIRPAEYVDFTAVREIFREVVKDGTGYVFPADASDSEIREFWFETGSRQFVAEDRGWILGIYKLFPAFPGHGSHLANAYMMVAPGQQRRGIGTNLAEHCLREAKKNGFRAMVFPYIISTNDASVMLWKKMGFSIAGTIPGGFNHSTLGYVDTFIMYRTLEDISI